jgi:hypothetical protein
MRNNNILRFPHDGSSVELRNCLAEAEQVARELSCDVEATGSGPIRITVSHSYYCRSTDAYAGQVTTQIHRVEDHAAADVWVAEFYATHGHDSDTYVEIFPSRATLVAASIVEDTEATDYVPF